MYNLPIQVPPRLVLVLHIASASTLILAIIFHLTFQFLHAFFPVLFLT